MKAIAVLFISLVTVASVSAESRLHIYTWADYLNPDVVEAFEDKFECKVVIDTFDSNEAMYAKLKAGATGYDVVFPSSYILKTMIAENMVEPLDAGLLPNRTNIDPEVLGFIASREMTHGVPYTLSYTVVAYRKDKVNDARASWSLFDRAELKPRMTLLNDMRETLGAALKYLGHSLNTRDPQQINEARDVVVRWKQNIAKFENEQYKGGVDSGEFHVVVGYSGDLFQVVEENPKVGILFPTEGVALTVDEMVIARDAPQKALAHQFINYLLDAEVSAENMEWMGYVCPNVPAKKLVSAEFLQHPAVAVPAEVRAQVEIITDVGADLAKYVKAWEEVKAAP
jgi:spermidine/putrescine transport system substrate-binding protein